jgi:hypothetical protein
VRKRKWDVTEKKRIRVDDGAMKGKVWGLTGD